MQCAEMFFRLIAADVVVNNSRLELNSSKWRNYLSANAVRKGEKHTHTHDESEAKTLVYV